MDLKELLGEELYNQVMAAAGSKHKIDIVSDGSKWIPKDAFNQVNEQKKGLEKTVTERDKQIESLKAATGDAEKLQQQIETLTEANKAAQQQYEADKKALLVENALTAALLDKANNPATVKKLIDTGKIELNEDGTIKAGLEDQIKQLKESDAYLFKPEKQEKEKPNFAGFKPGGGTPPGDKSPDSVAAQIAAKANARGTVTVAGQPKAPYDPWNS